MLEQIFSPLVIFTTPEHEELKQFARQCITRFHAHHYLGFAETQWKLFAKENPQRAKPLLYVYRVLLTGIHLMQSGEVEANLRRLNDSARCSHIDDLIELKLAGPEKSQLPVVDFAFHESEYRRLVGALEAAAARSTLPEVPSGKAALNDLLIRLRLKARCDATNRPSN